MDYWIWYTMNLLMTFLLASAIGYATDVSLAINMGDAHWGNKVFSLHSDPADIRMLHQQPTPPDPKTPSEQYNRRLVTLAFALVCVMGLNAVAIGMSISLKQRFDRMNPDEKPVRRRKSRLPPNE